MQGILAANNEAAQVFIHRGNYDGSIKLLQDALTQLEERDHDLDRSEQTTLADQGARFLPVCVNEENSTDLIEGSQFNPFVVYGQAFMIQCSPRTDRKDFFELYVPLVYNKALALHLRGLQASPTSQRDLLDALQLYKQGLSTIRSHWRKFDTSADVHLLFLALVNNALHLFSHFHCLDQARKCREQLKKLVQAFELLGVCTLENETEVFYLNCVADFCSTCAAAA